MPTPTYDLISSTTLAAATSEVVFGSLPQTYRDLVLVVNGTTSGGNTGPIGRFNLDAGTNYPQVFMWATTAAQSGTNAGSGFSITSTSSLAGERFQGVVSVMDYAVTDKHKTVLSRSGYTNAASIRIVEASASRWTNTAAITTFAVVSTGNNFAIGSTFNLFGVIS
jgi:hypothetical protein